MRITITITTALFMHYCAMSQTNEIELNSIELRTAIDMYMDSVDFKMRDKYGFIIIKFEYLRGHDYDTESFHYLEPYRFEIDSFSVQITAYHYKNMLMHDPPVSYFFYRGTPVVVYSGLERIQKIKPSDAFYKKMNKYLGDGKTGASKQARQWRVIYKLGKYSITDLTEKDVQFPY